MKKNVVRAVFAVTLFSAVAGLFSGCFLKSGIADGPGMVNYPGIMLDALRGDWQESDNGGYSITFWSDNTFSLSYSYEPLLENAQLTLYLDNTNTDEYSEFDVSPNVFTDKAGSSVEITRAGHENGVVTLELTAADGTKSTVSFRRTPENTDAPPDAPQDGPGMYYCGGVLDEAITGCWHSADGRMILDFNGKFADFSVDGAQLASKDGLAFVEHSFSAGDDLNERCELYPAINRIDDNDDPPFTVNEMWYQAEHIYMSVTWPDGNTDEIVFSKQDEATP